MGNKKAIFAVGTTALTAFGTFVACGSDKAKPDAAVQHDAPIDTPKAIDAAIDAAAFDFSCLGNSAPSVAANVTIAGTVTEYSLGGGSALGSAAVDLCTGNCAGNNNLGSATTPADGSFSFGPIATNGSALDGYVRVSHSGDRTVLGYPDAPIAKNITQPLITFQNTLIAQLSQAGCTQQAGNGMIGLLVADCTGAPINDDANITIAIQQAGSNVGDTPLDIGQFAQQAAGFYLICNVPPGTTTVTAKYKTTALRSHDVVTTAGTTTQTIIRPGY